MFRRYATSIATLLTVILLGIVHINVPVAQGLSSHAHTPSHAQHVNDSSCQTLCQAVADKNKNKLSNRKNKDNDPSFKALYLNTVSVESMGVGLLQSGALWRQSSWVPPDIALLSGYYSSSL